MYHVSTQGVDEHMINVYYYYYFFTDLNFQASYSELLHWQSHFSLQRNLKFSKLAFKKREFVLNIKKLLKINDSIFFQSCIINVSLHLELLGCFSHSISHADQVYHLFRVFFFFFWLVMG